MKRASLTTLRCMLSLMLVILSHSAEVSAAGSKQVLLLLSDSNTVYQHFAQVIRQDLPTDIQLTVGKLPIAADQARAGLIVTVGNQAMQWALENSKEPILATLVSLDSFNTLRSQHRSAGGLAAIYLDQPLSRQAALARAVLPDHKRVGVFYSEKKFAPAQLKREISLRGGELVSQQLVDDENISRELDQLLDRSDILLAVPDGRIFNSSTIRNILLGSYRRGIPLIGLTSAYVKAGALCAVYSTPEQLAAQAVDAIQAYFRRGVLPASEYPKLYQIDLNKDVARSLRLNVPSVERMRIEIERSMRGRE